MNETTDNFAFSRIERLEAPSGASIAFRHQPSALAPARGVLMICHGLVEHAGRYRRFADVMAQQGFEVYAHDHRGHGRTKAADAPLGRFAWKDGADKVVADVMAMRRLAGERHPGLPVILFGHSMGGLVALNTAVSYPDAFDGLSIWNSNLNPGLMGRFAQIVLRLEKMLKGSDVPSAILPKATFRAWNAKMPEKRTHADWLSHDKAAVDAYVEDPLCQFEASVSLWQDVFALSYRGPKLIERLPKALPLLLVSGDEDAATNDGREIVWLAERFREAGFSHVEHTIYNGMRHETLNEIGWQAVAADFAAWCGRVVDDSKTPSPSFRP
ncbi:UNVERIFIED_ORG: alpha-beta hydrolase superfamily lysophospholipase [Rhizobium sp. SORGH_AS260]|jgi:alpha-beta hydrolase superfamily lysophospholipase|uniref:alpha/beta hydrolase n=1 Tax=Agrobacterium sp. SORGH_AS_0440 TaxID=3041757 RepID=UPI0027891C84|nr:alpha/beta hydrolase [Agrobacterium sp. SORGH_AS_0440]MDP9733757.1 alpha-beta hydrolase superfamily lysophospholipase [Rhizobium sp. SORGH_AS_0285]MDP9754414.1 alpha-beta hydrolase superfamily lysophospholipase [Rhizobium sp. SORGH_AS_0260]MDR6082933.1 alpha-beta hydrolase superfamily lysophospholipase [Agrobacterium sp. SORGH_AS_0440]